MRRDGKPSWFDILLGFPESPENVRKFLSALGCEMAGTGSEIFFMKIREVTPNLYAKSYAMHVVETCSRFVQRFNLLAFISIVAT